MPIEQTCGQDDDRKARGPAADGIAPDIVNLAFGILLGTIAVSVALAFALGSRDVAAREVEGWLRKLRGPRGTQ